MPIIPRYDSATVDTVALPMPQAQAPGPEAFGAGVAVGLNSLSGVAAEIARKEQYLTDQAAVADAKTKLLQGYTELSVAAMAKQGEAATGYRDAEGNVVESADVDALTKFDDLAGSLSVGMNERQAKAFRAQVDAHRISLEHSTMTHVLQQREVVRKEKVSGLAEQQYQVAALAQTDEAKAQALSDLQDTLGELYRDQPEEYYAAKRDKLWSDLHTTWIESTLEKNPAKGKQMYEEAVAAGDLDAVDKAKLEVKVQRVYTATEGMAVGKSIWDTLGPAAVLAKDPGPYHGNVNNVPVDIAGMERAIKDKYASDPDLAKAAISELHGYYTAFKQTITEQRDYNTGVVYEKLAKQGIGAAPAITASKEFLALPGKDQEQFLNAVKAEKRYQESERKQAAQELKIAQLEAKNEFLGTLTPEILVATPEADIRKMTSKLGFATVNTILGQRKTLVNNLQALEQAKVDDKMVKDVALEAGLTWINKPATKLKPEELSMRGALTEAVKEASIQEQRITQKPITLERQKEIAQEQLRKITVRTKPGWFSMNTKEVYQFQAEPYNFEVTGATSEEVAMTVGLLKSRGLLRPTIDQVSQAVSLLKRGR